jgi:hypothetical protein
VLVIASIFHLRRFETTSSVGSMWRPVELPQFSDGAQVL